MLKFVVKRILLMIPVLLGISFILFTIVEFTPGDPAQLILGEGATREEIAELREEMGLNDNFLVRYVRYVVNAVQGDFGVSYRTGKSVANEVLPRFPVTLRLAFFGILGAVLIGVPIGILSAVKQYSKLDMVCTITALTLTSIPTFWLGLMLMLLFALKLGWLPATGIENWKGYVLPCVTLTAGTMAMILRMTRSTMLETIRQDYIRTARAKGAPTRRIVFKHALRNALLPVITYIGMTFGIQLGGTVIIESVFSVPGMGSLMITSIRMKDSPVLMACVLLAAFCAGIVNLIVDIMYTYIDPRVKSLYVKG